MHTMSTHHAHAMPAPMHTHHGAHGRARRPRRAAHTGTTSGTTSCTRAAGDVGPYHHAQCTPCPRTMHTHHGTHGRARRPRRAAHTGTTSGTTRVRGPPGTSAPTIMHTPCPHPCTRTMAPMVGRDVPGAPRPRGRHRERHVYAGGRAAVPHNAVSDFAAMPFPSLAAAQSSRRPTGRNEISLRNNLEGNNLEDAEIAGS